MSFSGKVKEELAGHTGQARHCQIAELAAILSCCAELREKEDGADKAENCRQTGADKLEIRTENSAVIRKCFTLLKKTFNIDTDIFEKSFAAQEKSGIYQFVLTGDDAQRVVSACRLTAHRGQVSPLLLRSACCRRAYLRGIYLSIGSMSNPKRSYHLEFVCADMPQAEQLCGILADFELEAKIIRRKRYYVVYLKEGERIVDLLNIMEAHVALMELENLRILKDISNRVNRRVNCEAANIMKTVSAASRQVEDIRLIQERRGLSSLPENLQKTAQLRLEWPDATLGELAQMMVPPIGKSGMNHRLRKLSEIAEELRESMRM
ncbi:MAG: DNA-binding protein WhiA [bacterium]|nr:DNA-binding protein WhiA [bacterium]